MYLLKIILCSKYLVGRGRQVKSLSSLFLLAQHSHNTQNACVLELEQLTDETIEAVEVMIRQQIPISRTSASCILQKCEESKNLHLSRRMQLVLFIGGFQTDPVLNDHLIRVFFYHEMRLEVNQVFNAISKPTGYTWAAIVCGYVKLGQGETALKLYHRMEMWGLKIDKHLYIAVLKACTITKNILQGRIIHLHLIECGLESDVAVGSTLVDMYGKCEGLKEACLLFVNMPKRNVVSWSAMITVYAQHGKGFLALDCFEEMQERGIRPDDVTFLSVLKACANIETIEKARLIHDMIILSRLESGVVVGSTLVDTYAKCGNLEEARTVFEKLQNRNVVSWNAMIVGYAQHEEGVQALMCFEQMQKNHIRENGVTYLGVLKACGSIGAIEQGRLIHDKIMQRGIQVDVVTGSTLVDMYAKCGNLEEAADVFHNLPHRNVVAWSAMIGGYAQHGEGHLAVDCFKQMLQKDIIPNEISFTSILIACSRAGLVDEGRCYFHYMKKNHDITPGTTHCMSMVDLLGRSGCLNEAEDLLKSIRQTDIMGWMSLLNSCKMYDNLQVGRSCFDQIVFLDSDCAAGYVLMANIYADARMLDCEVEILRRYAKIRWHGARI